MQASGNLSAAARDPLTVSAALLGQEVGAKVWAVVASPRRRVGGEDMSIKQAYLVDNGTAKKYARLCYGERVKDYRPKPIKALPKSNPLAGWQLTERDKQIVMTIPEYEGFLSIEQIRNLFFPRTAGGLRAAYRRCQRLCQGGYLIAPTRLERKLLPTMIYWNGQKGYELYKAQSSQTRSFRWVKKPRFDRVAHDLSVNDFHLCIQDATAPLARISLLEWYPGYTFETEPDTIRYQRSTGAKVKRRIEPDSFLVLQANDSYLRFGFELELAPKDTNRLFNDKILPLLSWVKSKAYSQRFGFTSGGFLFVFSDQAEGLMRLLIDRMRRQLGREGRYFHFGLMREMTAETVLTAPVWHKSTGKKPLSLLNHVD